MKKCVEVRTLIREMEEELILKRQEVLSLRDELSIERNRCQTFENRVLNAEAANANLNRHLTEYQKYSKYYFFIYENNYLHKLSIFLK